MLQAIWTWMVQTPWCWLIMGLVPYRIKRHWTQQEQTVSLQAFCWQLVMHWQDGHCSWELVIRFLKRLRRK